MFLFVCFFVIAVVFPAVTVAFAVVHVANFVGIMLKGLPHNSTSLKR